MTDFFIFLSFFPRLNIQVEASLISTIAENLVYCLLSYVFLFTERLYYAIALGSILKVLKYPLRLSCITSLFVCFLLNVIQLQGCAPSCGESIGALEMIFFSSQYLYCN